MNEEQPTEQYKNQAVQIVTRLCLTAVTIALLIAFYHSYYWYVIFSGGYVQKVDSVTNTIPSAPAVQRTDFSEPYWTKKPE